MYCHHMDMEVIQTNDMLIIVAIDARSQVTIERSLSGQPD